MMILIPKNIETAPFLKLECIGWRNRYPYAPKVEVALAHSDDTLFIHYRVDEETSSAAASEDFGKVWEDSCVELFCAFDDKLYYNIECNCIGRLLVCAGPDRHNREKAPLSVMQNVERTASLGDKPFAERAVGPWEVKLSIPITTFFRHRLRSFDGVRMRGNIYKCGDLLTRPHFLSYAPIDTPNPDFHRPEFFTDIIFE